MNIQYSVTHNLWKIADWIYPPSCAACGKVGFRFCPECFSKVKVISGRRCQSCGKPLTTDKHFCLACTNSNSTCNDQCSWAEYESPLREAIHKLKYNQDIGLADYFIPFLISLLVQKNWQYNLVIPVPISKSRKKERGYNQAELLSQQVANYLMVPHSNKALLRIKETESQIHLSAEDRSRNMEGAFLGNPDKLKDRKVLVVDDIITTGATMNHCATALLQAGALEVYGVSIAKTVRYRA